METQNIILITLIAIIVIDLFALYLLSNWVDKVWKMIKSTQVDSQNDSLQKFNILFDAIQRLSDDSDKIKSFFGGLEQVCTDFSETIRKERVQYYSLKEAHQKLIEQTKSSKLQKMLDISNAQVDALRRELEELKSDKPNEKEDLKDDRDANEKLRNNLKSKSEKGESYPPFSRYFEDDIFGSDVEKPSKKKFVKGKKQKLTDDREANKKLALQIEERKKIDPFGVIKMHELGKESKNAPKKKVHRKKFTYHAYNTPERMKELRRLKAEKKKSEAQKVALVQKLKDKLMLEQMVDVSVIKRGRPKKKITEPIVIVKNKVGRPKGSKNKFN